MSALARSIAAGLLACAAAVAGAGCKRHPKSVAAAADAAPPPAKEAQPDADFLGRQAFDVVDQAIAYQGSHRKRLPRSLRELGVDSLTHETIIRLNTTAGKPVVTVVYRRAGGHALQWCRADSDVLEDVALRDDRFTVTCGAGATEAEYTVTRR
jgi:hypothetical protein